MNDNDSHSRVNLGAETRARSKSLSVSVNAVSRLQIPSAASNRVTGEAMPHHQYCGNQFAHISLNNRLMYWLRRPQWIQIRERKPNTQIRNSIATRR